MEQNAQIIVVNDCHHRKAAYLVTAEEGIDIQAAFKNAKEAALEEQETCSLSEIPEEYLEKEGLKRHQIPVWDVAEQKLYKSRLVEEGLKFAACRYCTSYYDGFCIRHHDFMDPGGNYLCFSGYTNVYQMQYKAGNTVRCDYLFISDSRLDNSDVERILNALEIDRDVKFLDLKTSGSYDENCWVLTPGTRR